MFVVNDEYGRDLVDAAGGRRYEAVLRSVIRAGGQLGRALHVTWLDNAPALVLTFRLDDLHRLALDKTIATDLSDDCVIIYITYSNHCLLGHYACHQYQRQVNLIHCTYCPQRNSRYPSCTTSHARDIEVVRELSISQALKDFPPSTHMTPLKIHWLQLRPFRAMADLHTWLGG